MFATRHRDAQLIATADPPDARVLLNHVIEAEGELRTSMVVSWNRPRSEHRSGAARIARAASFRQKTHVSRNSEKLLHTELHETVQNVLRKEGLSRGEVVGGRPVRAMSAPARRPNRYTLLLTCCTAREGGEGEEAQSQAPAICPDGTRSACRWRLSADRHSLPSAARGGEEGAAGTASSGGTSGRWQEMYCEHCVAAPRGGAWARSANVVTGYLHDRGQVCTALVSCERPRCVGLTA